MWRTLYIIIYMINYCIHHHVNMCTGTTQWCIFLLVNMAWASWLTGSLEHCSEENFGSCIICQVFSMKNLCAFFKWNYFPLPYSIFSYACPFYSPLDLRWPTITLLVGFLFYGYQNKNVYIYIRSKVPDPYFSILYWSF